MKTRFSGLALVGGLFLLLACEPYAPPPATVLGMVHPNPGIGALPDPVLGYFVIDTDTSFDPTDPTSYTMIESLSLSGADVYDGQGIAVSVSGVPAGSYFVYVVLDLDSNGTYQTDYSDIWGYYGNTAANCFLVPAAPNLEVGAEGWYTCDFHVNVLPAS